MTFPSLPLSSPASILCHCFQISETEILAAIQRGASTVPEVLKATRAASGCGGCIYQVERMLRGLPPSAFQCAKCGRSSFLCGC